MSLYMGSDSESKKNERQKRKSMREALMHHLELDTAGKQMYPLSASFSPPPPPIPTRPTH